MVLWRLLIADFQKVKHTAFLWVHLIAPIVGSGLFGIHQWSRFTTTEYIFKFS